MGDRKGTALFIRRMNGVVDGNVSISSCANYFNAKACNWEPVIERFMLEGKAAFSPEASPNVSIAVDIKEPLNCNISNEMVKDIVNLQAVLIS